MKTSNTLGARTLIVAALMLTLAGCSSTAVPAGQNAVGTAASKTRPATACGNIAIVSGNNGTYSVAKGSTCTMTGPDDVPCTPDEQAGYTYTFSVESGASYGTFNTSGNTATFKRTSAGNVVIDLKQKYANPTNCSTGYTSLYGYVTLD